jgi:hypothetical protein
VQIREEEAKEEEEEAEAALLQLGLEGHFWVPGEEAFVQT